MVYGVDVDGMVYLFGYFEFIGWYDLIGEIWVVFGVVL